MGFYATEWLYGSAPPIPPNASRHVGAHLIGRVLAVLCHYADDDTGEACPSQQTIADSLGAHRRDVRHALDALTALGYITETRPAVRGRIGTTYRLALADFPTRDRRDTPPPNGRDTPPPIDTVDIGANGRDTPPINGRGNGRANGRDTPPRSQITPTTSSNSPGLVLARDEPVDVEISDEDLAAIGNVETRAIVAKHARPKPAHDPGVSTAPRAGVRVPDDDAPPGAGFAVLVNGRWQYYT